MRKRILSLFLTLALLCGLLPQMGLTAHAEIYSGYCGAEGDGSNLVWSLDEYTGLLTVSGSDAMADYGWTGEDFIDAPWNDYCEEITAVSLQEGVTSIGDYAFEYCSALTSVTIPDSVTSIGDSAFRNCSALTSVTIPDSVTSIGDGAFLDCSALTSVTIGNGVTSFGDYAFGWCVSLTDVTIPASVTQIGWGPFAGCESLTAISVASGNANYFSTEGVLFSKEQTELVQYPAGKPDSSYEIPTGVTSIGNNAFDHCRALTSVTIPDSMTSIGDRAFVDCDALTSVTIGNGVTSIGTWAFYGCTALTGVTFGNAVTSIGEEAFYDCTALTSVTIPASVTSIEEKAFGYYEYYSEENYLWEENRVKGFTINGYEGTEAQRYAVENEFAFVLLEGTPHVHNLVHHDAKSPTCTEIGWEAYDACTDCDYTTYVELPALGHDWDEPSYVWSDDNGSVTATRSCKRDASHVETETVTTSYQVTREATTEAEGEGVYTATFTNEAFATQTKTVSIPKLVQNPFVDVKESDFYFNPVLWAVNNNVTSGRDATHFAPNETVKRSEAMLFFYAAKGRPKFTTTTSPFKDVKKKHWFYDAVLWAVENKITSGTDATHFSPNKTCIRSEILQFLYAAMEKPAYTIENPYSDVKKKHWYYDGAIWAYEMGLERGSNGKFKAKTPCTRAYVVTYLYRFITGKELVK